MQKIIPYAHTILREVVDKGEIVIDATCGNGHDTLFLSQLVGHTGKVFGFDIQEQAINQTKNHLQHHQCHNVQLILDGHEQVKHYVSEEIAGAIFNLGYLPKGDHSIITKPKATIQAIQALITLLKKKGRIVLVVYHGHTGGAEEKQALLDYCTQLDQQYFQVLQYQFINQVNNPPFILAIEKIKETN
ncbi:class I SAM-dependent methyltransferase [Gracilibacillus sp. YIM 98692]|uniref:tRNA (mnm(5)s(2)U34)-methyltransferase n=1 Tax=Gracilibacillus sp. YIM 98692 TaxID=2663532 RepID=UPI0013D5A936|nr:class I SAM-dependent methyltransferase [Gracilibacillus sp. YIM 98692]